jgi:arylsulfatase
VWPLITGPSDTKNPHEFYAFYFENNQLQAITTGDGKWKLQLPHKYRSLPKDKPRAAGGIPANYEQRVIETAELYDLYTDISESKNVAKQNPGLVKKLEGCAEEMRTELGDSIAKRTGAGVREPGK